MSDILSDLCGYIHFGETEAVLEIINNMFLDFSYRDMDGNNFLMMSLDCLSSSDKNTQIINHFIKNSDLNERNKKGETALMIAIMNNRDYFITELISRSDLKIKNKEGNTALMLGVKRRVDKKHLFNLLDLSDVNSQNNRGETALMKFVQINSNFITSYHKVLKKILSMSDVSIVDNKNENALFYATNIPTLEKLIDHGTDHKQKNNQGKSVFEINPSRSTYIDNLLLLDVIDNNEHHIYPSL